MNTETQQEAEARRWHERHMGPGHWVTLAVSVGMSLVVSGVTIARYSGANDARLESLERHVDSLSRVDITPGAAQRIAVLEAKSSMHERQYEELRNTIDRRFDRLEEQLGLHMREDLKEKR